MARLESRDSIINIKFDHMGQTKESPDIPLTTASDNINPQTDLYTILTPDCSFSTTVLVTGTKITAEPFKMRLILTNQTNPYGKMLFQTTVDFS